MTLSSWSAVARLHGFDLNSAGDKAWCDGVLVGTYESEHSYFLWTDFDAAHPTYDSDRYQTPNL